MLPFPSKVKYIKRKGQKRERIWASRLSDHQLIDVTPLDESPSHAKLGKERDPEMIVLRDNEA